MCGFQSSRSRVIQTIQSQSPACFSYPFLSFLCQRTISVLASLRMCYEMISYLTQRTRHHGEKKKKEKKIHPHNCCVTPARLAKFFRNDFSCFFFFFFFFLGFKNVSSFFCLCVCGGWGGVFFFIFLHVWGGNQPLSIFVVCRQVSGGKDDNNRRSKKPFFQRVH